MPGRADNNQNRLELAEWRCQAWVDGSLGNSWGGLGREIGGELGGQGVW